MQRVKFFDSKQKMASELEYVSIIPHSYVMEEMYDADVSDSPFWSDCSLFQF
ncbi:MAG: hypothetical protein PWQ33_874 [Pseudothermotoga sp.]|jgi:hypothetical protein|nr:hypothetical protein [Pseudothermotoga sp.]